MSIDSPPIPPDGEPKKKNTWLWGCLIAFLLGLVTFCCAATLFFMPLFSDRDPLGTGLRDRIEEYLPMDYLDDPSSIPGFEDLLDEQPFGEEENAVSETIIEEVTEAEDMPLAIFKFIDIGASFYYPVGWDIEMEGYGVTFYDPDSYTYIYIGEDLTDEGTRAEEIAVEIVDSVQEEAQEGTFNLISSTQYSVAIADDAHLTLFEWVDQDGYYTWAYDLEMVSGESNYFIFLSGEYEDEIPYYGDLLDILASSLEMLPDLDDSEDT